MISLRTSSQAHRVTAHLRFLITIIMSLPKLTVQTRSNSAHVGDVLLPRGLANDAQAERNYLAASSVLPSSLDKICVAVLAYEEEEEAASPMSPVVL